MEENHFFNKINHIKIKIMTEMTEASKEIRYRLHEVSFECIDAIKAQLERLGWYRQYDECEQQRITISKLGHISVEDIYLDEKEPVLIYHNDAFRRIEKLSTMVMHDYITPVQLSEILEGLEKIKSSD
jgi:hypothetical protein